MYRFVDPLSPKAICFALSDQLPRGVATSERRRSSLLKSETIRFVLISVFRSGIDQRPVRTGSSDVRSGDPESDLL
ncbi:hypothetical protein CEXT_733171 [Caerostris extrusa]|uniref:Uncharacterized protein n=1 Tax=Caerostris extrusa TaxID=172846 RepID=A0AAV4QZI5_CAEEX|nr:hypothetical protein CEXT_733171 [Caerostris extrusa]